MDTLRLTVEHPIVVLQGQRQGPRVTIQPDLVLIEGYDLGGAPARVFLYSEEAADAARAILTFYNG